MEYTEENIRELAERIYDLDCEVYVQLGSTLGRVYNADRERCVGDIIGLLRDKDHVHTLRSELALISNMARTIKEYESRELVMKEYNAILQEVIRLPIHFGKGNIIDPKKASLNSLNIRKRFQDHNHRIICISRTYGSGANSIGFALADSFNMNYYDVEIFNAVLKRLDAEKDFVIDNGGYPFKKDKDRKISYIVEEPAFIPAKKLTFRERIREFSRYHGLTKRDAVFFNQSDLICDMAKKEDFIVMGRCADVILTNNHIPHISIFITAPLEQRVNFLMSKSHDMTESKARKLLKRTDAAHRRYYRFYTGRSWGDPNNYDLCINSADFGIHGTVELIHGMIMQSAARG